MYKGFEIVRTPTTTTIGWRGHRRRLYEIRTTCGGVFKQRHVRPWLTTRQEARDWITGTLDWGNREKHDGENDGV